MVNEMESEEQPTVCVCVSKWNEPSAEQTHDTHTPSCMYALPTTTACNGAHTNISNNI